MENLHVTYMRFFLFLLMPAVLLVVFSMQHMFLFYCAWLFFK